MCKLVILVYTAIVIGWTSSLEMPKYTVVDKNENYEERSYPVTMWVSTTDENPENIKGMFLRLFYYMQGANQEGRNIEMTAPLLRHTEADGNVTLMLYLPDSLQDKRPMPTDLAVNITFLPERNYVVWLFGGFATEEIWAEELEKFKNMVEDDGNVTTAEYFAASYSGLHDLIGRRNEIWFIRNPEEVENMEAQA